MDRLPETLTVQAAAKRLGLPINPLLKVVSEKGYVHVCGARKFVRVDELGEIIEACRQGEKAPASTSDEGRGDLDALLSEIEEASKGRLAQSVANKLKWRSRPTSETNACEPAPRRQGA